LDLDHTYGTRVQVPARDFSDTAWPVNRAVTLRVRNRVTVVTLVLGL
jgi:hypothetical protein